MELIYKKASLSDVELLAKTRIEVLRATNKLNPVIEIKKLEKETRRYYEKSLTEDTHVAYLVFDNSRFIGSGGICFYQVMPSYYNQNGLRGNIMNMYTSPDYRRRGIAYHTLDLLVEVAREREVNIITLESTDSSRLLYEKYGFRGLDNEMQLIER